MNFHNWMDTRSAEFHADGLRMLNNNGNQQIDRNRDRNHNVFDASSSNLSSSPSNAPSAFVLNNPGFRNQNSMNSRMAPVAQNFNFVSGNNRDQFSFGASELDVKPFPVSEFGFGGNAGNIARDFHPPSVNLSYPSIPSRQMFSPVSPVSTTAPNSECSILNSFDYDSDDEEIIEPVDPPKKRNFVTYRERRREAHTQAEQKRRDGIKKGYQELQQVLPQSETSDIVGNQKASKAAVLQKSIDYLTYLIDGRSRQQEELNSLRRELTGLNIMKQNYEKMALNIKNADAPGSNPVSESEKFKIFQYVMEDLFQSFDTSLKPTCFAELSGTAFAWLEEYCTPQRLRQAAGTVLSSVRRHSTE